MSKNKDQKRKAQLAARVKNESFRFQVEHLLKQKGVDITGMEQDFAGEVDAICQNGLAEAMLDLAKIIEDVRNELGVEQEAGKCSLNGTLVPFILGITKVQPDATTYDPLIKTANMPLQVTLAFDNEVRNRVVDLVKSHYDSFTTRLGQPILKLQNMVIEFKRVLI